MKGSFFYKERTGEKRLVKAKLKRERRIIKKSSNQLNVDTRTLLPCHIYILFTTR